DAVHQCACPGRRRAGRESRAVLRLRGDCRGPGGGCRAGACAGRRTRRGPRHGLLVSARRPDHSPTAGSRTMSSVGERLSVFVLAAFVLVAIVAVSFGAGWLVGKILL